MDLWSVHVKNVSQTPLLILSKNAIPPKRCLSFDLGKIDGSSNVYELRISKLRNGSSDNVRRSFVLRAMGKKNHGNSSSSGSDDRSVPDDGTTRNNPSSDSHKSNEAAPQNPQRITLDWREFRAALFAHEQEEKENSEGQKKDGTAHELKPLAQKWAHPISLPEPGCVLVATEKLDGVQTFERTVVVLLRSGSKHPHEGPFGIIINRPLNKRIKNMKPTNLDLATTFTDCVLHFGGPLEACMFLFKTDENKKLKHFEQVMPGLYFGARNSLDDAARLVKNGVLKPQDFRFFVGYGGWQLDQLKEEIEADYWHVASCSSNLLCGKSEGLWVEILQLMGGDYSELSRKPKQQDH